MSSPLTDAVRSLRHAGLDAVREFVSRTYYAVRPATPDPDPVLERDWDLLVVLDACRADVFAEVVGAGDYDLPTTETATSQGSTSKEWLSAVFGSADDDALAEVAYVTGNPYSTKMLDLSRFGHVDEVWRDGWDDDRGTIPPRPITNRAIEAGREQDTDRMVVHYMQPHFPSIVDGDDDGIALDDWGAQPMSVWEELRFGHRDVDDVWESYRRNLEAVLEDVELLLSNVDAERVVVTADHGNAFGEHYIFGHPGGVGIPALREVPWSVTAATDEGTHDPAADAEPTETTDEEVTDSTVEDRLESLGYRT
ncbi:hypothetical protein [Halobacterium wangiae]|uniref:hypothetical protein n=1 Tax=Halobacterium wangiae TaxID=2902623 RepID=UPI001E3D6E5E|nr:hypothetical protein [Halobacterium wangiae]